jgi:hypothetical protein
MKTLHLSLVLGLAVLSCKALAQDPIKYVTQACPPASAFHHYTPGDVWYIDEPYKSQGWRVLQTPLANWSRYNSIPNKTILSVRIHEEGVYIKTGETKKDNTTNDIYDIYDGADVSLPVTCNYSYVYNPHDNWDNRTLVVQSPYTSSPGALFESKENFKYQNDCFNNKGEAPAACAHQEANWGFVCNTTAGHPEACQFKVVDLSTPPNDDFLATRKMSVRHTAVKK